MHVDVKVSVWQRIHLPESVSKEDVIDILKNGDIEDLFQSIEEATLEELENSDEDLTPADNDNQATIQFYESDDDNDPIWSNAIPEPVVPEYPETFVLERAIVFKTNEYSDTPSRIRIELLKKDIQRIVRIQKYLKENDITSAKIDFCAELLGYDEDPVPDWHPDAQSLLVYAEKFYYCAQSKYDATDQIESESMSV